MKDASALARRVAKILGDQSAAAGAVKEYDLRKAQGEAPVILWVRGIWIVGPRLIIAICLAIIANETSSGIVGQVAPYVSQCYQETYPDEWYVDCHRRPDGSNRERPALTP